MNEWKVNVSTEGALFATGQARILVGRSRGDGFEYLLPGGGSYIETFDAGDETPPVGFVVPHTALPALAEALVKHLGDSLPSAGEVRVLREWLEAERVRTDAALHRAGVTGNPPGVSGRA